MVNFSGFRNRFFKKPNVVAPKTNTANVGPNSNLEKNVRAYVNGYIRNRNTNKLPNLNKAMVLALHKYVNFKRPRAAGTVAGVLGNAKAPETVQLAGGLAAGNVPLTATPAAAGSQVGNNVKTAGGNATQAAAAAAAAAKQQAVSQGKPANVANGLAAAAAAKAANTNTQTPNAASNAARNGAAAAGLPANASQAAGVMAQEQRPNANETGGNAPLVLNDNVPGTNNKVKVKRNNVGSNWYFANSANNSKYNLNNRNQNTPRVRTVGTGNLFKQGN